MNELGSTLYEIISAVVSCCSIEIRGKQDMSIEDVLGKCRLENVILTRQIATMQLSHIGYTITTLGQIFGCSQENIRKLLSDGYNNLQNNTAFRIAYVEATRECKKIIGK